jgi:peptide deformylase
MKIYTYGHPVLRKKAKSVQHFDAELRVLCKKMIDTMRRSNPRGVGLAAPQVGISLRLITIEHETAKILCLANPEIVCSKGEQVDSEGCLSIPGVYANVKRADSILVKAIDPQTKTSIEFDASGFLSRVIQHEIDHINGVLFTDYFDDLSRLELAEDVAIPEALLRRYAK